MHRPVPNQPSRTLGASRSSKKPSIAYLSEGTPPSMAPSQASKPSATKAKPPPKLPRLPSNARVQKRPLLHPPIPSPYAAASSPKVIYISASTPFISAVKRVRKLLVEIEKRATRSSNATGTQNLEGSVAGAVAAGGGPRAEEVLLKGTNRAIEKVLQLALFFQGQGDVKVRIGTGSVGAVDDIEVEEDGADDEEVQETRVRRVSVVEVGVSLK
ncbi:MAG: hypothetical protein Q9191_005649 [Dirinaria sp. TL-2023a]